VRDVKLLAAFFVALSPAPAWAHGGEHSSIGWTLDPTVTVPLILAAAIYAIGFVRLRRRARSSREKMQRGAWLYAAGWLTMAGAIVSPLHEAGEHSFTFHMIEHELLMLPAALLLVAARPGPVLLWGLPRAMRHFAGGVARLPAWRFLTDPVVATAIQGLAIWLWHAPGPFDTALRHEGWHIAQHVCFVASALLFWWAVLHRANEALAALCLFVTSMIGGALGALMALSDSPWYSAYGAMGLTAFGLSPTEDQQLAGLIMWVPGGLFHLAAALLFVARWLSRGERRDALATD
jgi:cytochrome c oxidase assembly factor CtaG